jgi:hypothetical protein
MPTHPLEAKNTNYLKLSYLSSPLNPSEDLYNELTELLEYYKFKKMKVPGMRGKINNYSNININNFDIAYENFHLLLDDFNENKDQITENLHYAEKCNKIKDELEARLTKMAQKLNEMKLKAAPFKNIQRSMISNLNPAMKMSVKNMLKKKNNMSTKLSSKTTSSDTRRRRRKITSSSSSSMPELIPLY